MIPRAFEESAENRKILDGLVRTRAKSIRKAIEMIPDLRPEPRSGARARKRR